MCVYERECVRMRLCALVCVCVLVCVLVNSISAMGSCHLKALGFLYSNQRHPEAKIKGRGQCDLQRRGNKKVVGIFFG